MLTFLTCAWPKPTAWPNFQRFCCQACDLADQAETPPDSPKIAKRLTESKKRLAGARRRSVEDRSKDRSPATTAPKKRSKLRSPEKPCARTCRNKRRNSVRRGVAGLGVAHICLVCLRVLAQAVFGGLFSDLSSARASQATYFWVISAARPQTYVFVVYGRVSFQGAAKSWSSLVGDVGMSD